MYVRILNDAIGEFKRLVDAKAIAPELRSEDIIPEAIETQIIESNSFDKANNFLLVHLRRQATLEDLLRLCSIMKESKGYRKMQGFGETLQARLEKVGCVRTCRLQLNCHLLFVSDASAITLVTVCDTGIPTAEHI